MPTKQITSSTLWQIASQATMAVLSAVSAKFVAMALSTHLAGHYNSVYSYLQLFSILADFGLYAVAVREVSGARDKEQVFGALLTIRFFIASLALGSAVLVAWVVPAWHGTPLPVGISITAFVPFFTLLAGVLRTVFQVHYRMRAVFVAEVTQRIVTLSLMTAAILLGIRGSDDEAVLRYFFWVGPIGASVLLLLSFVFARRILPVRPRFDPPLIRRLLRHAAPYGLAFLCIALYRQSDLTIIALLRDDFALQNAYYGFAVRVAEMTYLVPTFLLNSTLPILAGRRAKGESVSELLGSSLLMLITIAATASLFSFFWSRPVMQVLTTDQYLETALHPGSDTALRLLALPMFCNALILYAFYVLLLTHAWRPLIASMIPAVLLSVILNLRWVPADGFVGAIHTSAVVQSLLALLLLPQALRRMPPHLPRFAPFRLLLFLLVLTPILAWSGALPTTTSESAFALLLGALGAAGLASLFGLQRFLRLAES